MDKENDTIQATSLTHPGVPVGGTYQRPNTEREQSAIDKLYERISPSVFNSVQLALTELVQRSDGDFENLETLSLDKRGEIVTSRCFQTDLKKALRGSNLLPYQQLISDEMIQAIDNGELDLISYCNGLHGCKNLSSSYYTEGTAESCRLAVNGFLPLQIRKLQARLSNTTMYQVRGDEARYISWRRLWDAISPPTGVPAIESETLRFSLPTAIMTLRLAATKYVPPLDDFFYYDHPQNSVATATDGSTNKSGAAFSTAKKTAEAFNALIFRHHGEPELQQNPTEWKRVNSYFFSSDDVKRVVAILSRICHSHPEQAEQQCRLFFSNSPSPPWRENEKLDILLRPICTIDSAETLATRVSLYQQLQAGELKSSDSSTSPVLSDPANIPDDCKEVNEPTLHVLGHPASFKWEKPRDSMTCQTGMNDSTQNIRPSSGNWRTNRRGNQSNHSAHKPFTRSKDTTHLWRMKH